MNKLIVRVASALLALVLLLACPTAMADTQFTPFSTDYLSVLDYSVTEWTSSDFNRAMLVVCTMLDLLNNDLPDQYVSVMAESLANDATYVNVLSSGTSLSIEFFSEDINFTVYYNVASNTAQYCHSTGMSPSRAASLMKSMHESGSYKAYYLVEGETVYSILESLLSE